VDLPHFRQWNQEQDKSQVGILSNHQSSLLRGGSNGRSNSRAAIGVNHRSEDLPLSIKSYSDMSEKSAPRWTFPPWDGRFELAGHRHPMAAEMSIGSAMGIQVVCMSRRRSCFQKLENPGAYRFVFVEQYIVPALSKRTTSAPGQ
jgi:hypothetical protein